MPLARKLSLIRILPFVLAIGAVAAALYRLVDFTSHQSGNAGRTVHVLTYSAFVSSWGPGPEIAKAFHDQTGMTVEFQEADDAGLLLRKLELFPADAVLGFDQLSLDQARGARPWRDLNQVLGKFSSNENIREWSPSDFMVFDWAPMSFVYRKSEIAPPSDFSDLLDARFNGAIALEDPRTSTPGLQFMFWVLDEMGIDQGFDYLKKLKPQLQSVSASWSAAYGLFTEKQAKLAFSYATSPIYHEVQEKNSDYAAALFQNGQIAQFEYAGVPASCENCEGAFQFLSFLARTDTQRTIMQKNYMFPVIAAAMAGTPFESAPKATVRKWKNLSELLQKRDELLKRWQENGM